MILKWFASKTVRKALATHKHVWKLLSHQRDILSANAISEVESAMGQLKSTAGQGDKAAIQKQMDALEKAANKWLKPYPNAGIRENVEMLLVALAVAMAIRTFFLQPFKIPTGSMQPTLFGVTSTPDFTRIYSQMDDPRAEPFIAEQNAERDALTIPTGWARIKDFFHGISYVHLVADQDGTFDGASRPLKLLIFNIKQTYWFAGHAHTIWFPPDYGSETAGLEARSGLHSGQYFHKGDDIVKMKVSSGDYLFVDRLTYNFRPPERGEIVVFQTKGIPEEHRLTAFWTIPPDQFYIKRLIGLSGERVKIGDDRHVVINDHRLDASTPHFENVYSFDPDQPPRDSHYSGHIKNLPHEVYFNDSDQLTVPTNDIIVMGDNTVSSLDSRFWGPFPESAVIGKYCLVYWPLTKRFGWSVR